MFYFIDDKKYKTYEQKFCYQENCFQVVVLNY